MASASPRTAAALAKRRAFVARAKTRAQRSQAAKRAHGAQIPRAAIVAYTTNLLRWLDEIHAQTRRAVFPQLEALSTAHRPGALVKTDAAPKLPGTLGDAFGGLRIQIRKEIDGGAVVAPAPPVEKFVIRSSVPAKNGNTQVGGTFKTREAAEARLSSYHRAKGPDGERYREQLTVEPVAVEIATPAAGAAVDKMAADAAARTNALNGSEIKRLIGIDPRVDPGVTGTLEAYRRENVRLITTIPEALLDDVESVLAENFGLRAEALAKLIEKRFEVSKSNAKRIARDQTLKLNGQLTRIRMTDAGIDEYEWVTSNDERVRESHNANAGQVFRFDSPPAETGNPGEDVNCRCTAYPKFPEDDETEAVDDAESEEPLDEDAPEG